MVAILEELWLWFVTFLKTLLAVFFAGLDGLLPSPPDLTAQIQAITPYLMLANRFVALDWLLYYGLTIFLVRGGIWAWRMTIRLWELVPFN
jgi:hypothetical protein